MAHEAFINEQLKKIEAEFKEGDFPLILTKLDCLIRDAQTLNVSLPPAALGLQKLAYAELSRSMIFGAEIFLDIGNYLQVECIIEGLRQISEKIGVEMPQEAKRLQMRAYKMGIKKEVENAKLDAYEGRAFNIGYFRVPQIRRYAKELGLDPAKSVKNALLPLTN